MNYNYFLAMKKPFYVMSSGNIVGKPKFLLYIPASSVRKDTLTITPLKYFTFLINNSK